MADSAASVYSTALFEICTEQDCLNEVFEELKAIEGIIFCKENQAYCEFLQSPMINWNEKEKSLKEVFEGRLSPLTFDFICLLSQKKRFNIFGQIFEDFKEKYNDKMNILEVTVITSIPLKEELSGKLKEKLEKVSNRNVVLSQKVDKAILGGIILKYGNTQIDSSVKSRLEQLKKNIGSIIA